MCPILLFGLLFCARGVSNDVGLQYKVSEVAELMQSLHTFTCMCSMHSSTQAQGACLGLSTFMNRQIGLLSCRLPLRVCKNLILTVPQVLELYAYVLFKKGASTMLRMGCSQLESIHMYYVVVSKSCQMSEDDHSLQKNLMVLQQMQLVTITTACHPEISSSCCYGISVLCNNARWSAIVDEVMQCVVQQKLFPGLPANWARNVSAEATSVHSCQPRDFA